MQTFLGVRHVFLPHKRLLTWAEKNVDQSQQTSRSGKCTLDLEKFRAWLYGSRKDQKGRMKVENLTVLEQTTQLTHKRSYQWLPSESRWKKLPWRLNLLNGGRAFLQNNNVWKKKKLPFVQSYKVTPLLHHPKNNFMSKWHLIQPLQKEIYKKRILISYYSRQEQKSLVMYISHSTELVLMCLAFQHFDFNSTDWISDNLHVICEQWERNLSSSSADVHGTGMHDEPLRTSAWEARSTWTTPVDHPWILLEV